MCFWKTCKHLEKQECKSANKDHVVRVSRHFNTTVWHQVMATASHIDENCKQLSQVPTKTVRNQKEDWVAEIRLID